MESPSLSDRLCTAFDIYRLDLECGKVWVPATPIAVEGGGLECARRCQTLLDFDWDGAATSWTMSLDALEVGHCGAFMIRVFWESGGQNHERGVREAG